MSRIDLLQVQLDEAYGRLSRRLEGLADEEYRWQPVPGGWSIRRGEDVDGPRTTTSRTPYRPFTTIA